MSCVRIAMCRILLVAYAAVPCIVNAISLRI